MSSVEPNRYQITSLCMVGDPAQWLEAHGQRAVLVGLPGAAPAGVMWTRRDDPNAAPRFARVGEGMVYDPETGNVTVGG